MSKRIYYLTSEIIPFAETYKLASFSKGIPGEYIDRKYDFRLMMPKYGFISDRRYILREVIRLRDMKLNYMVEDIQASVKSAFIPNTKVQVYFLEHEKYFKPVDEKLYVHNSEEISDLNSVKFGYFSNAALMTLNYLRWKPDVIICNDWQMSLIPLFLNSGLINKDYLDGVKVIQILHSKSDYAKIKLSEYKTIGLDNLDPDLIENDTLDSIASSISLCDHVIFTNYAGNELIDTYNQDKLLAKVIKQNESKITKLDIENESQEDWAKATDEITRIIEQL